MRQCPLGSVLAGEQPDSSRSAAVSRSERSDHTRQHDSATTSWRWRKGQMQPCIAQRTPTWRPDCLPGSAGGQGVLSRSATKTPTALARPACRPMGGGGRNIPIKQSLSHCAWCFPISGAAVQQAGGHGGRTQSEYSESSPSASGFARHCTPPRRPGPQPATPGPAARCLELATNGIKIKKKKLFFFDKPAHEASSKLLIQLRRWDLGQIRTTRALARCSGNIHGSQEPRVQPRRRIGRCADELGSRR